VIPQADDAEDVVIGSMITDPSRISDVLDVLEPHGEAKFYKASHGRVYSLVKDLWAKDKPIDLVIVGNLVDSELRQRVIEWVHLVTATSNVAHHAKLVRDAWVAREVIAAGHRLISNSEDPLEALSRELRNADSLVNRDVEREVFTAAELAEELFARIQDPAPEVPGIPAPLSCMPRFVPGRVYVIAGYTAHGKTIAATQVVRHACEQGFSVNFHPLEMSKEDSLKRLIATFGVPYWMLDQEKVEPRFMDELTTAMGVVHGWRLNIVDNPSYLAGDVLRTQRACRSDLIVFDHLHRMRLPGKPGDRRHMLEDQVRDFVNLAKTENVPVVLLAQLSRPGYEDRKPGLTDLRETAIIEQEAAYVAFVWRASDDEGLTSEGEWIVGKNRFGRSGGASRLVFDSKRMVFSEPRSIS